MLRNRTFLAVLRHAPLRAPTFAASPSSSKLITRQPRILHAQQRRSISTKSTNPTHFASLLRWRPSISQRMRNIRWNSNKSTPSTIEANGNSAQQSVSQRFKELSRRYGYAAVGVYLGLSVLDFPFCFLAVRLVGPERIGELEHAIVDAFWNLIGIVIPSMRAEDRIQNQIAVEAEASETQPVGVNGHKQNETASIWTQLLLAYGVHKSLIFFRVPLTAAVTPKVVKTLRSWGWNIGRPAKRVKSS